VLTGDANSSRGHVLSQTGTHISIGPLSGGLDPPYVHCQIECDEPQLQFERRS